MNKFKERPVESITLAVLLIVYAGAMIELISSIVRGINTGSAWVLLILMQFILLFPITLLFKRIKQ